MVSFEIKYSKSLTPIEVKEIIKLFNLTFSNEMTEDHFKWKYQTNPSSNSFHLLGKNQEKLVLCRNFWSLDILPEKTVQCVDTIIHPNFQGYGLFSKSQKFLDENCYDVQYYNLPNSISRPIYLKKGWLIKSKTKIKLTTPKQIKTIKLPENIDYLNWRYVEGNKEYFKSKYQDGWIIYFLKYRYFPVAIGFTKVDVMLDIRNCNFFVTYDDILGIPIRKKKNITIGKNMKLDLFFHYFDMF